MRNEMSLHHSYVDPLSLSTLQSLCSDQPVIDTANTLVYGTSNGLLQLRKNISLFYAQQQGTTVVEPDDILITLGAISANHLVLDTVVSAGDHVIVAYPTYGQLQELPKRLGASVSLWRQQPSKESSKWTLNVHELEGLLLPTTKLIIMNNPSNPTGCSMSKSDLEGVIRLAERQNIMVMCDEVFRFMHHDVESDAPPSLLELNYPNTIVTGSLSKAFALPGIRVGWIAAHPALRQTVLQHIADTREYTTIAVSQVDQQVATFATTPEVKDKILARSLAICRRNTAVLRAWVEKHQEWVRYIAPIAGGTCVLQILGTDGLPVDDTEFAAAVTLQEGVCVPPAGRCFGYEADGSGETDFRGYLRIGIVSGDGVLEHGLAAIEKVRARWA